MKRKCYRRKSRIRSAKGRLLSKGTRMSDRNKPRIIRICKKDINLAFICTKLKKDLYLCKLELDNYSIYN